MSLVSAQAASSGDGVAAAEDAVRALWSALNRLDHSLTYLLPENCDEALNGKRRIALVCRDDILIRHGRAGGR
jgi:hypothetical protein